MNRRSALASLLVIGTAGACREETRRRRHDDEDEVDARASTRASTRVSEVPPPVTYPPLELLDDVDKATELAKKSRRPLLVFFTASWSAACKEMEKRTLGDEAVKKAAARFVGARVDCTNDDEKSTAIRDRYGVIALPMVIFFDSAGKEASRLPKYVEAKQLLEIIAPIQ